MKNKLPFKKPTTLEIIVGFFILWNSDILITLKLNTY